MSNFMGAGIFWIGLNRADIGCWRLTLSGDGFKPFSKCAPLSCQYVSTIPEKNCMLKNGHFIRVCTERMMDHQCGENGERNIYSNYNQMRANVECFPNQP